MKNKSFYCLCLVISCFCELLVKGGVDLIYTDNKDGLWMQQGQQILRIHQQNGKQLPQSVPFLKKSKTFLL